MFYFCVLFTFRLVFNLVVSSFQWSESPLLYIGYPTGCFIRPFANLIKVFSEGPRLRKGPRLYQQECILAPSRLNKIVSVSVQFREMSILDSSTPYNILYRLHLGAAQKTTWPVCWEDAAFDLRRFASRLRPLERFRSSSLLDHGCKMRRVFIDFYFSSHPHLFVYSGPNVIGDLLRWDRSDVAGTGAITWILNCSCFGHNGHGAELQKRAHRDVQTMHSLQVISQWRGRCGGWFWRWSLVITDDSCRCCCCDRGNASHSVQHWAAFGRRFRPKTRSAYFHQKWAASQLVWTCTETTFFYVLPGLLRSTSVAQESTMTAFTPVPNPVKCKNIYDSCLSRNHGVFFLTFSTVASRKIQ